MTQSSASLSASPRQKEKTLISRSTLPVGTPLSLFRFASTRPFAPFASRLVGVVPVTAITKPRHGIEEVEYHNARPTPIEESHSRSDRERIAARRRVAFDARTESRAEPVFRIRVRLVDARARLAVGRPRSSDRQRACSSRAERARVGGDRRRATIRLDVVALSSVVAGRSQREAHEQVRCRRQDTIAGRAVALVADGRKRPPTSAVRLWRVPCGQ